MARCGGCCALCFKGTILVLSILSAMVLLGPPEFLREEWEQVKRALVPVAYRRRAETPAANVHAFAAIRRIRAPAPWDTSDENVWIVDRTLEPQTVAHFVGFCVTGRLPNGQQSTQANLFEDEIQLLTQPYAEWAPTPYNEVTESAAYKIMGRIGSEEDFTRLVILEQSVAHMKSKLWEGITPISDGRWRALGLDDPKRHTVACDHIGLVISVFDYLNSPEISKNLRDTFNLISEHLSEFDVILNKQRERQDRPPASTTSLWTEYMTAHYEVMAARAHHWALSHIEVLRDAVIETLGQDSTDDFDEWELEVANRIHNLTDLAAKADTTIFIPMEEYRGYKNVSGAPLYDPDLTKRTDDYYSRVKSLSHLKLFQDILENIQNNKHKPFDSSSKSMAKNALTQKQAQAQARAELRGEPQPLPKEAWVEEVLYESDNHNPKNNTLSPQGYVIYRLTHQQTEEEWELFKRRFDDDIYGWGDGILGAADIKDLLTLSWVDGSDLGIAENDFEAAKRHFKETLESPDHAPGRSDQVFLVVDEQSVKSYLSIPRNLAEQEHPGENTGFVVAIDAHYDPEEPDDRADESPGYYGVLRILGSLVWSDLYAMMTAQNMAPRDHWPLAMIHPQQVYIGPVSLEQRRRWASPVHVEKLVHQAPRSDNRSSRRSNSSFQDELDFLWEYA